MFKELNELRELPIVCYLIPINFLYTISVDLLYPINLQMEAEAKKEKRGERDRERKNRDRKRTPAQPHDKLRNL